MVVHPVPGKLGRERPRGASAHEQEQVPQLQLARGEVPEVALASKLLLGAKVTPETKRAVLQIIDDIEYDIALGHRHVRV